MEQKHDAVLKGRWCFVFHPICQPDCHHHCFHFKEHHSIVSYFMKGPGKVNLQYGHIPTAVDFEVRLIHLVQFIIIKLHFLQAQLY